jgi:transcriptional regulator NrdR family protein
MEKQLECPFCEHGISELKQEITTFNYKKEEFEVNYMFYQCSSCLEKFTTTESDDLTLKQVYNQYRIKHEND